MDQTINVNITPGQFRPSLHYSQGDVGRVFKVQVVDFDIPANSTVQCVATKPSGLGFTLAGTVSGNEITFVTTDAVTDEWGRFPAEVKIINGGNVIGTANFLMIGEKNPHPDSTIDGKQEEFIPLLTLLVERIEAAAEDVDAQVPVVQQAADDAAASAAAASDSADSASDSATSASGSANEASNSAIAAAASASSAATSAEDAKESAEAFVGENYVEDTRPYLFRQTGDGVQGVGTREKLKSIVGATVAWNQLMRNGNFADGTTDLIKGNNTTLSVSNGVLTLTCVDTSVTTGNWVGTKRTRNSFDASSGDKILVGFTAKTNANFNLRIVFDFVNGQASYREAATVIVNSTNNTRARITKILALSGTNESFSYGGVLFSYNPNTGYTGDTFEDVICVNLSKLFSNNPTTADYIYQLEQATAGAGVAFFRKYFGDEYYPYDAGTLKSVEGLESHDTIGFNQWDEEWEAGGIDPSTGINNNNSKAIRSKNYIKVLSGAQYYLKTPQAFSLYYYDADKNFIGLDNLPSGSLKTISENVCYIRFRIGSESSPITTYHHDICINISDPAKNGTYEPYSKHSYPLDSSLTLRGLLKLANGKLYADGDEYKADGSVNRRYGVVDLGTLTWSYNSSTTRFGTTELSSVIKSTADNNTVGNIICVKYIAKHYNAIYSSDFDKFIAVSNTGAISIRDTAYTDATAFTSSLSGVYLVYELATPTTESADPYTELQICDPFGTEEFVTDGIVPVGNVTQYPEDLKAKLEGLPWNFSTLIALTEATSTASRAYAIGDYLILNNVLYKVTAAISSGGTITVGTNVVATTVTDEIKALRS